MEYEILKNLHGFQLPRVESLEAKTSVHRQNIVKPFNGLLSRSLSLSGRHKTNWTEGAFNKRLSHSHQGNWYSIFGSPHYSLMLNSSRWQWRTYGECLTRGATPSGRVGEDTFHTIIDILAMAYFLCIVQVILRDGQTFSSTGPKWKLPSGIKDQVFYSKSHYGRILQRDLQEGTDVQEVSCPERHSAHVCLTRGTKMRGKGPSG